MMLEQENEINELKKINDDQSEKMKQFENEISVLKDELDRETKTNRTHSIDR